MHARLPPTHKPRPSETDVADLEAVHGARDIPRPVREIEQENGAHARQTLNATHRTALTDTNELSLVLFIFLFIAFFFSFSLVSFPSPSLGVALFLLISFFLFF